MPEKVINDPECVHGGEVAVREELELEQVEDEDVDPVGVRVDPEGVIPESSQPELERGLQEGDGDDAWEENPVDAEALRDLGQGEQEQGEGEHVEHDLGHVPNRGVEEQGLREQHVDILGEDRHEVHQDDHRGHQHRRGR